MQKIFMRCPLSFYVVFNTIYFNVQDGGVPHPELWNKIVMQTFIGLTYENKIELVNHCYGVDRGRIVYIAEEDKWVLYGTPGCALLKDVLIKAFSLIDVNYTTDFKTDIHYRTKPSDVNAVSHALKFIDTSKLDPGHHVVKEVEIINRKRS